MVDQMDDSTPMIRAIDAFSYFERVYENFFTPIDNTNFNQVWNRWFELKLFDNIISRGQLIVSYNGSSPIPFSVEPNKCNRHQVIAVSAYLRSRYYSKPCYVIVPHENVGEFNAKFNTNTDGSIQYINQYTSDIIKFTFNPDILSQFTTNYYIEPDIS
jgi:hypothetical protein